MKVRVQGLEVRVQGSRFRGSGSGFRVSDSGFRVSGVGCREAPPNTPTMVQGYLAHKKPRPPRTLQ